MFHTQPPNLEVHNVPLIYPLTFDPNSVLRPASRDVQATVVRKYIGLCYASYWVSRLKAAVDLVSINQF